MPITLEVKWDPDRLKYSCVRNRIESQKDYERPTFFCAHGDTTVEALGNWFIAHREIFGLSFTVQEEDGETYRSTNYGR